MFYPSITVNNRKEKVMYDVSHEHVESMLASAVVVLAVIFALTCHFFLA
jgi:hypothetical protein